jgi:hypothetical protein
LASGLLGIVRALVCLAIAVSIIASVEIALLCLLRKCALRPELADIPAVGRYRERLCSARTRLLLATSMRRTAQASPRAQISSYVLWDRVALVRDELLALADELESADTVDPRTIIEIRELLSNGRDSPLLNDRLPTAALVNTVRCARFRLATAPIERSIRR